MSGEADETFGAGRALGMPEVMLMLGQLASPPEVLSKIVAARLLVDLLVDAQERLSPEDAAVLLGIVRSFVGEEGASSLH